MDKTFKILKPNGEIKENEYAVGRMHNGVQEKTTTVVVLVLVTGEVEHVTTCLVVQIVDLKR